MNPYESPLEDCKPDRMLVRWGRVPLARVLVVCGVHVVFISSMMFMMFAPLLTMRISEVIYVVFGVVFGVGVVKTGLRGEWRPCFACLILAIVACSLAALCQNLLTYHPAKIFF